MAVQFGGGYPPQKATITVGAYHYSVRWGGKEYPDGRRFIKIYGVGNSREYTVVANAQGDILENVKGFSGAQAAVEALGWKEVKSE